MEPLSLLASCGLGSGRKPFCQLVFQCHNEGERCVLVCNFGDVGSRCLALLPLGPWWGNTLWQVERRMLTSWQSGRKKRARVCPSRGIAYCETRFSLTGTHLLVCAGLSTVSQASSSVNGPWGLLIQTPALTDLHLRTAGSNGRVSLPL